MPLTSAQKGNVGVGQIVFGVDVGVCEGQAKANASRATERINQICICIPLEHEGQLIRIW